MAIMAYNHEYSQYLYYICVRKRPTDEKILFLKNIYNKTKRKHSTSQNKRHRDTKYSDKDHLKIARSNNMPQLIDSYHYKSSRYKQMIPHHIESTL